MTKHLEKLLQGCERAAAAGNIPVSKACRAICWHPLRLAACIVKFLSGPTGHHR